MNHTAFSVFRSPGASQFENESLHKGVSGLYKIIEGKQLGTDIPKHHNFLRSLV
jgi:hypothetical protein